jgi:2-methylcitrate dehydratase PrpD
MKIAQALGDFIAKTAFQDLPSQAVEAAKDRILDLFGVALTGYQLGEHKHLFNVVRKDGNPESTIIGEGVKVPCNVATLVNGSMANLFIADGSRAAAGHPSAVVIPASLALAERERVKGMDLILAVVLGYEAMIRVGSAMLPGCAQRGFHPTSVTGSIGSAAASGKLLKLDAVRMAHAISVAADLGAGFIAGFKAGDYLAELQAARAAEAGVLAVFLAQDGFKGYEEFFEEAYFRAYADKYSPELVTRDLGKQFAIVNTYVKQHWACGHLLAPIDCTLELLKKYKIRASDVDRVNIYTYSAAFTTEILDPPTGKDAGFSAPFIVSLLLLEGAIPPASFNDDKVKDQRVQELMKKVHTQADPESDKLYPQKRRVTVEILTKDGKKYSQKVDAFKGEPDWPLTRKEIQTKFTNLSSPVIGEERAQEVVDYISRLEEKDSIQDLGPLLKRRER